MMVGHIGEFTVIGAFDRGLPNTERIAILVNSTVDMGQFGLLLGIASVANAAFPIKDNFYWFGDGLVNMGDWIMLYTGPGKSVTNEMPGSKSKIYTLHWGREKTILTNPNIVPILFRVEAVQIPEELPLLPGPAGQQT